MLQVVITGTIVSRRATDRDIAIDDISHLDGVCPGPGTDLFVHELVIIMIIILMKVNPQ